MKKHFHKLATYAALILISSMPLSVDVFADAEKTQDLLTLQSDDDNTLATK